MNNVIRRDGTAVAFDPTKIENAVAKAFMATDELDARDISSVSRAICLIVTTTLNGRKLDAATVEEIQDEVESALMNCGYAKTAKAYILYRRQHANVRETKDTLLDYKKLIVLPDALSLIIEFLYRLVVVNSYVSDRLIVVCYRASIKVI